MLNGVLPANAVPPLAAPYHCTLLPVAAKIATVGLTALQKLCALAVGAAGVGSTVTLTDVRLLSHPLTVWLA